MGALESSKRQVDSLTLQLQRRIDALPIFESCVEEVQRRHVRKAVVECVEKLRRKISEDVRNAEIVVAWKEAFEELLQKKSPMYDTGSLIRITPQGEVSVPRHEFASGTEIWLNKTQFSDCLEKIKECVCKDKIDIRMSPEDIMKNYLIRYHEENKMNKAFSTPFR